MRLLLDTNHLLFIAQQEERLTQKRKHLMNQIATELWISTVSLWEIRLKNESLHPSGDSKLQLKQPINEMVSYFLRKGIQILVLETAHVMTRMSTPLLHKDPFDRLLILQAQVSGLKLLTSDKRLADHPLVILA